MICVNLFLTVQNLKQMGKLILITGYPCATTVLELVEFLREIFRDEKLQNVWFDPYREPQAVAMFMQEIDETRLFQLTQHNGIEFQDHFLTIKSAEPTQSVFVRTFGAMQQAPTDKLGILFKKKLRPIQNIQQLDDDCFEITFTDGWDAVLEVCGKEWIADKIKLSVCPYFNCFKENLVDSDKRLLGLDSSEKLEAKNEVGDLLHIQETLFEDSSSSIEPDIRKENETKTSFFFDNAFMPSLLTSLKFEKALQSEECYLIFHKEQDSEEVDIDIVGSKIIVKKVVKLLHQEYEKVKAAKTKWNFFSLQKVQEDLKDYDFSNYFAVLTILENNISLEVADINDKKISFQEFVSSLVLDKKFPPLPSEECPDNYEMRHFIENYNETYQHSHIFSSDKHVTLLFLSHKIKEFGVMCDLIQSKFDLHLAGTPKIQGANVKNQEFKTNLNEASNINDPEAEPFAGMEICSQGETKRDSSKTYVFKQYVCIFLLDTLNLKSDIENIYPTLTLELRVLDLKAVITGQSKEVDAVQKCLKYEDETISLTENETAFLNLDKIKAQLLSIFAVHQLHIALEHTNLMLAIEHDGKKDSCQEYLKSLLVTQTCITLPSIEFFQSQHWQNFQKSFNSEYKFCEIFVTDQLEANLLSLAHKGQDLATLIHIVQKNVSKYAMLPSTSTESINLKTLKDKKISKYTVICQNKIYVWLLEKLNFKKVILENYPDMYVEYNVTEKEVVMQGAQAKTIKALVLDGQISFTEYEEAFLENPKTLKQIKKIIKKHGLHLVFRDSDLFVKYQDGQMKRFGTFTSALVVVKDCLDLPNVNYQNMRTWISFVESVQSKHPLHQISVEGCKVKLTTLMEADQLETNGIERDINTFLSKATSHILPSSVKEATKENQDDSSSDEERHSVETFSVTLKPLQEWKENDNKQVSLESAFIQVLTYSQPELHCCALYLQQELHDIEQQFKDSEITIGSQGIQVKCNTQHSLNDMCRKIASLFDTIEHIEKGLQYPGLISFFESDRGFNLLSRISRQYKCYIEAPMDDKQNSNSQLEVLDKETQRINYQVTLLGTAKCDGFKVHLVQGNIRDMRLDFKVTFCPSPKDQECTLTKVRNTREININLPSWKAPIESKPMVYFSKLRESLRSLVNLVFQQVMHLKSSTVAFCTAAVHDAPFPFPLDVIAKIVTEELLTTFNNPDEMLTDIDFYICEPKIQSVFKAFTYFMKTSHLDFGPPHQISWDKISNKDTCRYTNYSQHNCNIKTIDSIPANLVLASKSFFCYPIQPSLEASSCPLYNDPRCPRGVLESSLKTIQKEFPDGLLLGDFCHVSCIPFSEKILLYCFPEWGSDIYQTLQRSLEKIFEEFVNYESIIIILPGIGAPEFPKQYLVQTFFKIMDKIVTEGRFSWHKKIFLLVQNIEFKKAFDHELQKRYQTAAVGKQKSTLWQTITSPFTNSSDSKRSDYQTKGASSSDNLCKVNTVAIFPIIYWGNSKNLYLAHSELEIELQRLMAENIEVLHWNEKETSDFEAVSKKMKEISVSIKFEKSFKTQKQWKGGKRGNSHQQDRKIGSKEDKERKITFSKLTIQGLSINLVKDFAELITIQIQVSDKGYLKETHNHGPYGSGSLLGNNIPSNPTHDETEKRVHQNNLNHSLKGSEIFEGKSQENSLESSKNTDFINSPDTATNSLKKISSDSPEDKAANRDDNQAVKDQIKKHVKNKVSLKPSFAKNDYSEAFKWMYEKKKESSIQFVEFDPDLNNAIERAYLKGEMTLTHKSATIKIVVDFCNMTVVFGKSQKQKGLIRIEQLKSSEHNTVPKLWSLDDSKACKVVDLVKEEKEYTKLKNELTTKIGDEHEIEIKQIKRIENVNLYQRFKTKRDQLEEPHIFMWHKVSEENVPLICEFGFHPRFSAMHDEKLGDGVLFKENPLHCFDQEITDKMTVHLLKARLMLGKTGPGREKLRYTRQDGSSQPLDSVKVDDQAMIFSDAQAYPCHLFCFKFEK
ncbi:unnamed protein product [Lymnaea stagnalis]|uniref:Poly [ADP-ribose] polymerase n=1 Tax=Lymnaea stagnalis TaxID=6523 RepID=A0AAV2IJM0_LYMST